MQSINIFTKSPWSNVLSRESDRNPSLTEEMGDVSRLIKLALAFYVFFLLQQTIKEDYYM